MGISALVVIYVENSVALKDLSASQDTEELNTFMWKVKLVETVFKLSLCILSSHV